MKQFEWLTQNEWEHDRKWWEIYGYSFPPEELDTKKQLLQSYQKGIVKIGRHCLNGETIAIVVIYPMQRVPFLFLNFFAISSQFRGQHLGTELFSYLVECAKECSCGLIWEVEDPLEAVTSEEKKRLERRIKFYERQGAKLFANPFIQPPVDGEHIIRMRMMFYSEKNKEEIILNEQCIKEAIYFEKYKVVNHINDQCLRDLLEQCQV